MLLANSKRPIPFLVAAVALFLAGILWTGTIAQAAPVAQESDADTTASQIYLPFVLAADGSTTDVPLSPDQYAAESEEAPELSDEQVQASTYCSTYIKFRNESSYTIKIYWKNSYGQETLYKTLSSGYYYWQHTYYGHSWRVRDTAGNLLKSFTVNTCSYVYVTIDNHDFPQPTATPTATPTSSGGGACYTEIVATHSNKCMQSTSSWFTNKVEQQSCDSGSNQKWAFYPVSGTSDVYVIKSKDNGKALDVEYNATSAGKKLEVDGSDGSNSQKWQLIPIGNDIYELKNVNSGLVADVEGNSTNSGADIIQWHDNNTANQRWKIENCVQPQPTPTNTPVPPTPTPTNTSVPPTPTNTSVPPTATPTNTTVPPTPTNTPEPQLGSIGDKVFRDANGNGQQDAGESGVSGVSVQLRDCSNNILQTTTTDGNGNYGFSNLTAGCYVVRFVDINSELFQFSPANQGGNDALDSDVEFLDSVTPGIVNGQTANINLNAGETDLTVDAGLVPQPQNTASLGDRVWRDDNGNGQQDAGEPGLSGVTVQLRDCSNNILQTTTTDGNGNYSFSNLAAGCYRVTVLLAGGATFSPQNVGNDNSDSDVNPSTGTTDNINLAGGENNPTVDAGIVPQAQNNGVIGDKVFRDENGNGQQDTGEPGVSGVTVQLKDCSDNILQTTTTDGSGGYSFSGLAADCYTIGVVLPNGFAFSPQNVGNDNTDSDINPGTSTSDPINLGANETNTTVDAGLVPQGGGGDTCIGDRTWRDDNMNGIQDAGEPGLDGVEIYLGTDSDGDGNIDRYFDNTTSANGGQYEFCGLDPNIVYAVQFGSFSSAGYCGFTLPNVGTNDAIDSDPDISKGIALGVVVVNGQQNDTIDAGYVCHD